jgi:enolase
MVKITKVAAREILDSRGYPTIETTVWLNSGHSGTASVPSGGGAASRYEAVELRDGDPTRFLGLGVLKAVKLINEELSPGLIGQDPTQQTALDQWLIDADGTPNKSRCGANALLSVSTACLKAAAGYYRLPVYRYIWQKYYSQLPLTKIPGPIFNIINGGAHGAGNLDFQEFHLIPSSRYSFRQALQVGQEVYQSLRQTLKHRQAITSVGDEGGFAPNLFTNMDALSAIIESLKLTSYDLAKDVFLGLDVAADWFYKNGRYEIKDRAQPYDEAELIAYFQDLVKEFHLFSLEDGLHQDAWNGWSRLSALLGDHCLIIGDDLLSTNRERINQAAAKKACNAILVKPNQVGTLSETLAIINLCRQQGWKIIVSHRSGETNDAFIADFSVGVLADHTKFGAPVRGERVAKYNRLLAIADELKL